MKCRWKGSLMFIFNVRFTISNVRYMLYTVICTFVYSYTEKSTHTPKNTGAVSITHNRHYHTFFNNHETIWLQWRLAMRSYNAFTECYQSYPTSISNRHSCLLKEIQEASIICKYLAHFWSILESQSILGRGI